MIFDPLISSSLFANEGGDIVDGSGEELNHALLLGGGNTENEGDGCPWLAYLSSEYTLLLDI